MMISLVLGFVSRSLIIRGALVCTFLCETLCVFFFVIWYATDSGVIGQGFENIFFSMALKCCWISIVIS